MKKYYFVFILTIFLSSCYPFGNGSPPAGIFWQKNGERISHSDALLCSEQSDRITFTKKERKIFNYLSENIYKDPILKEKENDRYWNFREKYRKNYYKCLYKLGYKWIAPFYWCNALDADNREICKKMEKYRN